MKNSITDRNNSIIFRHPIRLNCSCLLNFTKCFLSNLRHHLRETLPTSFHLVYKLRDRYMHETYTNNIPASHIHWKKGEVIFSRLETLFSYVHMHPRYWKGTCKNTSGPSVDRFIKSQQSDVSSISTLPINDYHTCFHVASGGKCVRVINQPLLFLVHNAFSHGMDLVSAWSVGIMMHVFSLMANHLLYNKYMVNRWIHMSVQRWQNDGTKY